MRLATGLTDRLADLWKCSYCDLRGRNVLSFRVRNFPATVISNETGSRIMFASVFIANEPNLLKESPFPPCCNDRRKKGMCMRLEKLPKKVRFAKKGFSSVVLLSLQMGGKGGTEGIRWKTRTIHLIRVIAEHRSKKRR